jgi:hypothetical protein
LISVPRHGDIKFKRARRGVRSNMRRIELSAPHPEFRRSVYEII